MAEDWLLCRACRARVTRPDDAIEQGGAHAYSFVNPHGLVFEIGCFARAPGCRTLEAPTLDWTWFPGWAWQPAACAGCGAHLGWRYRRGAEVFYGLILARLQAAPPPA